MELRRETGGDAPAPIRVLIVEDQVLLRQTLRRLLESEDGVKVVGEAGTVQEAIAAAERLHADLDIIIMDIRLPDGSGLDAAETIERSRPGTRILVLTAYDDIALVERAMALKVAGYAPKNSTYDELITALNTVRAGETYVHPVIARRLMEGVSTHLSSTLTPTELRILQYMAEGLSYGEIAAHIYTSEKTVRRYVGVIFSKMHVSDKAQAVAEALRRGLLA